MTPELPITFENLGPFQRGFADIGYSQMPRVARPLAPSSVAPWNY
jgi:hypothetical protein